MTGKPRLCIWLTVSHGCCSSSNSSVPQLEGPNTKSRSAQVCSRCPCGDPHTAPDGAPPGPPHGTPELVKHSRTLNRPTGLHSWALAPPGERSPGLQEDRTRGRSPGHQARAKGRLHRHWVSIAGRAALYDAVPVTPVPRDKTFTPGSTAQKDKHCSDENRRSKDPRETKPKNRSQKPAGLS